MPGRPETWVLLCNLMQSAESILQHYDIKELESGYFVVCEYDKASIIRKTSCCLIFERRDFKSAWVYVFMFLQHQKQRASCMIYLTDSHISDV